MDGFRTDRQRSERPSSGRLGADRPDGARGGAQGRGQEPKEWRPGLAPKENEPSTPKDVDLRQLPRQVRAELKGLPEDLADVVGAHLLVAGQLIDTDPELAYAHAEAARRRASRLPIMREACAETAYAAGKYDVALNEFRALRRMSGGSEYIAAMADCERALGRPDAALALAREGTRLRLDRGTAAELLMVEAGAREDKGQRAEGLRLLRAATEQYVDADPVVQARLRYALAEMLLRKGDEAKARQWLTSATRLDPDDESGAAERLAELDGVVVDLGDDDPDDADAEDPDVGGDAVAGDERP